MTALAGQVLGKRGDLAQLKTKLGGLTSVDDRKAAGQALNEATEAAAAALDARRAELAASERAARVEAERLDLTEIRSRPRRGHAHIVTQAWERLEDVFVGLGFQIAEGPEVETDWHNFEALNMGEGHPARSDFDTLFVDHPGAPAGHDRAAHPHVAGADPHDARRSRRRSTSSPPAASSAATRPTPRHMPVFHQIEGLVVDRDISLAHLAGTIEAFTKAFFGAGFTSRLRPSYFPFTEPSGRVRHPDPDAASGSSSAAAAWSTRTCCAPAASTPSRVERVRVRLRHRPHGQGAPQRHRPPRDVHRRHPLRRAVLRSP